MSEKDIGNRRRSKIAYSGTAFIGLMVWEMWPFVGVYGLLKGGTILLLAYFFFLGQSSD
jgi:hypothetical protein